MTLDANGFELVAAPGGGGGGSGGGDGAEGEGLGAAFDFLDQGAVVSTYYPACEALLGAPRRRFSAPSTTTCAAPPTRPASRAAAGRSDVAQQPRHVHNDTRWCPPMRWRNWQRRSANAAGRRPGGVGPGGAAAVGPGERLAADRGRAGGGPAAGLLRRRLGALGGPADVPDRVRGAGGGELLCARGAGAAPVVLLPGHAPGGGAAAEAVGLGGRPGPGAQPGLPPRGGARGGGGRGRRGRAGGGARSRCTRRSWTPRRRRRPRRGRASKCAAC
ncbi:unnamed protein product [Heterosigma akashiwo]